MYAEIIDNHHGRYIPQIWAQGVMPDGIQGDRLPLLVGSPANYNVYLQGSGVAERHAVSPLQYPLVGDTARCTVTGTWFGLYRIDIEALLDGPENSDYEDAWYDVLVNATFKEPDGTMWHLYQGEGAPDLYLIQNG